MRDIPLLNNRIRGRSILGYTDKEVTDHSRSAEIFRTTKKKAIESAKDLLYGEEVVKKLEAATTTNEISNILKNARLKREEKEDRLHDLEIEKKIREMKKRRK